MLSSLTINDQAGSAVTLHETSQRAVLSAGGLVGISPPRRSARPRPTGHGSIDDTRYTDEQLIEIAGDVWATTQQLAFAELRAVTAPMLATLDGNPALLKWTEGSSGLALQRLVKLAGPVNPPLSEGMALLRYQAVLAAADPRAYAQSLTTVTSSTFGAGGAATFNNQGNRPTPVVIQQFPGGGTGAAYRIRANNNCPLDLRFGVIGAPPNTLILDMVARTATLFNTTTSVSTPRNDMLASSLSIWAELPPGSTTLTLTADGSTPHSSSFFTVTGRSAY